MELLVFDFPLTLGQRVRLARIGRRLRQSDLARMAGVQQHEVSRLELDRQLRKNAVDAVLGALGLGVQSADDAA